MDEFVNLRLTMKSLHHFEEPDPIQIVCTIDENFAQHCAVMLTSLFEHARHNEIVVTIVSGKLKPRVKSKLSNYINKLAREVHFIEIEPSLLKDAPTTQRFTLAAYYRLLLPDLLSDDIKKVLYLDSDLIFKKNVAELWQTDISQHSHAAAVDYGVDTSHKQFIGLSEFSLYFNSGVMLINLEYWRNHHISARAIEYIKSHPQNLKFVDQDVLNYLLEAQWYEIQPTWNASEPVFNRQKWRQFNLSFLERQMLNQAIADPAIIHYTTANKPWYYSCNHPYKQDYYYYLQKTPWRHFTPIGKPSILSGVKNLLKRLLKCQNFFPKNVHTAKLSSHS